MAALFTGAPYGAAQAMSRSSSWAIIATVIRLYLWRVGFGLGVLLLWELAAGRWMDPVEPAYRDIARVMGAGERQIFLKVALPAASPWIVSALKVGVPFSLIGAVVGEFMAASRGPGYMIQLNTNQFDTTGAAAGILVLMLCVMLFNGVLNRLERYVLRWRPRERMGEARELQ